MTLKGAAIGLIVNPIAGMGGRVGLKGTDGPEILAQARSLGAEPHSGQRATDTLRQLFASNISITVKCPPGEMGEIGARAAGFDPELVGDTIEGFTASANTVDFARQLIDARVDLLLFTGGDGTARDMVNAIGLSHPVLGIPAGVKIHSAVYAKTPKGAAHLTVCYLSGRTRGCQEAEVMDIDEDGYRQGHLNAKLYGYLKIPADRRWTQGLKAGTPRSDQANQLGIAEVVVSEMEPDCFYIIGPGSTTATVLGKLGLPATLLGVDLVYNRKLVGSDLNETDLLAAIGRKKTKIILTPIGGQGFILGRGNQQISQTVLQQIGKDNLIIITTKRKILDLGGRSLLIDTGAAELDEHFKGFYKIITDYNDRIVYKAE
ncbi:MAG: ATP-NAD kinase family protein [Candidatus Marinimicrobia bacterium]|nr:ATP-NAD kinase family protein [Candidatus Neomarinimicrobiota bacterium]